jgi:peptide deformylase
MPAREIVLLGDPILRDRAREVDDFDRSLRDLVRDMFITMATAEGAGLAAPQVGVGLRVLVADVGREDEAEGARIAVVNPQIVEKSSEEDRTSEGCLSIPGVTEVVSRPTQVLLEGFDPEGAPIRIEASGLMSRVLQHEVDHLDGVLFFDRLSPLKRRMLLKKYRKLRAEEEAAV